MAPILRFQPKTSPPPATIAARADACFQPPAPCRTVCSTKCSKTPVSSTALMHRPPFWAHRFRSHPPVRTSLLRTYTINGTSIKPRPSASEGPCPATPERATPRWSASPMTASSSAPAHRSLVPAATIRTTTIRAVTYPQSSKTTSPARDRGSAFATTVPRSAAAAPSYPPPQARPSRCSIPRWRPPQVTTSRPMVNCRRAPIRCAMSRASAGSATSSWAGSSSESPIPRPLPRLSPLAAEARTLFAWTPLAAISTRATSPTRHDAGPRTTPGAITRVMPMNASRARSTALW